MWSIPPIERARNWIVLRRNLAGTGFDTTDPSALLILAEMFMDHEFGITTANGHLQIRSRH